MNKTKIEWCDVTINPFHGCSKISEGCANCYAERMAGRLQAMGTAGYEGGFTVKAAKDRLRGMTMDPSIPQHAKSAMLARINQLEAAVENRIDG
jgi:protein gp37